MYDYKVPEALHWEVVVGEGVVATMRIQGKRLAAMTVLCVTGRPRFAHQWVRQSRTFRTPQRMANGAKYK